ncbi:hypothetical protein [Kiritimatiella glycovorans]|uniref:hypothetical protein n=1 Tax=Kiritimatiella glycovorans TaxID=1307763 RepID=UPI001F1CE31C|nr:hypothetical protein [Kiritimatiella glycovorans]
MLLILNGVADRPLEALEGRTPLDVARVPHIEQLAREGQGGMLEPAGDEPREEAVILGELMGMAPGDAAGLRSGPLDAAAAGLEGGEADCAFSASAVTLENDRLHDSDPLDLSSDELRLLGESLENDAGDSVRVMPVARGRAAVLLRSGGMEIADGTPPWLWGTRRYSRYLDRMSRRGHPAGDLMERSRELFRDHPVNRVRVDLGEDPADSLWLWGGGAVADFPSGYDWADRTLLTNASGARGLAGKTGMPGLDLHEPWNAGARSEAFRLPDLVAALRKSRLLILFAEAPRAGGRFPGTAEKIRALETFDRRVLDPLLSVLEASRPYRIALTSDRVFSSAEGRPVADRVPFIAAGEGLAADDTIRWSEEACAGGSLGTIGRGVFRNMTGA